jgi:hypothetical protein
LNDEGAERLLVEVVELDNGTGPWPPRPGAIHLYVEDADATYGRWPRERRRSPLRRILPMATGRDRARSRRQPLVHRHSPPADARMTAAAPLIRNISDTAK